MRIVEVFHLRKALTPKPVLITRHLGLTLKVWAIKKLSMKELQSRLMRSNRWMQLWSHIVRSQVYNSSLSTLIEMLDARSAIFVCHFALLWLWSWVHWSSTLWWIKDQSSFWSLENLMEDSMMVLYILPKVILILNEKTVKVFS